MKLAIDRYPSRIGQQASLSERQDEVVYSPSKEESPIAYELINQYREQGYLMLDTLFSADEINSFQKAAQHMLKDERLKQQNEVITEPGSGDVRSIFRVHSVNPVFRRLVSDQRLVRLAEYILNDQVYIHQSRLNFKPGFRGKEFYWHSDFETWHVEDGMPNMRALSMSISLTDNYELNGPLMLIPGSHKHYVECAGDTPPNHFQQSLKKQDYGVPSDEVLDELVSRYDIATATGKSGSVTIFDCNTMHGSNGNITPYPRSNIFLVYNALSNRLVEPYCQHPPRPEYIASRKTITPVKAENYGIKDYEYCR
jgi:ectoine hydroxylase